MFRTYQCSVTCVEFVFIFGVRIFLLSIISRPRSTRQWCHSL